MVTDKLMQAQGRRLREARISAGFRSARSAAKESEWPESTYRAHEGGTRTIGLDDADRYARRFGTTTARQILFGEIEASSRDRSDSDASPTLVPLISWVSAGRLADSSSAIPASEAKVIPFADLGPGDYFALAVRGDSMDRISPENSIILVNRRETSLLPDRAYIFSVRGEATYKLWKPKPPRLDPYSTNPANQPIFVEGRQKLLVVGRVRRTLLDL